MLSIRGLTVRYRTAAGDLTALSDVSLEVPRGGSLAVGATLDAEVWLQGHVLDEHALRSRYEGVDYACSRASFWSGLRRRN